MRQLVIEPASGEDVTAYLRMRDEAAEQMVARGIVQWRPGELTEDALRRWAVDGEIFAARLDGTLVGGLFVMWSDPVFWGDRDDKAGYTHGLLVDRRLKGEGLGRRLLAFAEEHIRDSGRALSRLDTVTTNAVLRGYYRAAGYREVGERTFEGGKVLAHGAPIGAVTLFEKSL
ncbi:MAG: GNAT family N-acetyltransferase [Streptosporangiales bacterium]|nr:GNAT family N-acetyltransferase [Streptosporangiales bacterium]